MGLKRIYSSREKSFFFKRFLTEWICKIRRNILPLMWDDREGVVIRMGMIRQFQAVMVMAQHSLTIR